MLQERYDDRDYSLNNEGEETSNETKNKIQSHHVTFTGLKAGTTYRLNFPSTVSLSSVVESDVSVSTFSKENEPSQPNPIYGKLVDNADKSIKDAIVFISLSNSQSEQKSLWGSTIPNDNGGWTFDLNLLTNEEGEVAIVGKGDTEIIRVASYNSKINNEYYKVKPDEDQPVGNLIVDNTKLESESNESFLPFVKTLERSSVLGAQSCSCDCNGTSDKYCGKLGTDQQTIDGKCYEVELHCNATYDSSNNQCNSNHEYGANPKKISDGPCGATTPETPTNTNKTKIISDADWGNAGEYCIGNSIRHCSSQYSCDSIVDPCENVGCSKSSAFSPDKCNKSASSTTSTTQPIITQDQWGGAGDYCLDSSTLAHCTTQSSCTTRSCPQNDCTPAAVKSPDYCFSEKHGQVTNTTSQETTGINNLVASSYNGRSCISDPDCGGTGLVCNDNICKDLSLSGYVYYSEEYQNQYVKPQLTNYSPPPNKSNFVDTASSQYFSGVHSDVKSALDSLLEDSDVSGYLTSCGNCRLFINSGFRSIEDQQKLRDAECIEGQATSSCGVANAGHSQHHSGRALDLYIIKHLTDGKYEYLSVEPLQKDLLEAGFVHPISWDTPHYFLPEPVEVPVQVSANQPPISTLPMIMQKANAQEIDNDTLTFSTGIIDVLESGTYTFDSNEYDFGINDIEFYLSDGEAGRIVLFEDTNKNGVRDDGEGVISDVKTVQLNKTKTIEKYDMSEGWQIISLTHFSKDGVRTAKDLLNSINAQGGIASHIFTYRQGKFYLFSMRENGQYYGNDFNLIPGQAYFVRNYKSTRYFLSGQRIAEPLSVNINPGWNLVSIFNPDKVYTAVEILSQMNNSGLDIKTLSAFDSGKYNSILVNNDEVYGQDYPIDEKSGYFVKSNSSGTIEWTPK